MSPSPLPVDARPPSLMVRAPARLWGRLARLTLKELRETLRDRRTIFTLVLMPVLLYPLLSIALKQVFFSALGGAQRPKYRIAVAQEWEGNWIIRYLKLPLEQSNYHAPPPLDDDQGSTEPRVWIYAVEDLEAGIRNYQAEVGIRIRGDRPPLINPTENLDLEIELLYMPASTFSRDARTFVEQKLAEANTRFLTRRLEVLGVTQPAVPVRSELLQVTGTEVGPAVSLVTLVPLILILMTITGAVYPAIDLTAGERERGTLEVLVASPVPRLGLLMAKYVAVLTVALLTATVNLAAMTATILLGGLGQELFGAAGLTPTIVLQVLGLLMLFATFFSAVLLTLTSFARSFKEAQAYLIPLMMVSIAPGLLSLAPDLKLSGMLAIAPLVNIVLLARDLLQGTAEAGVTTVVVISTLLYAVAAIGMAARFFAAEAVLYSTESGWSDLFQRPAGPRDVPNPANALFCLAAAFPAFFVALNLILRIATWPIAVRLAAASLATSLIFAGLPLAAALIRRVRLVSGFRIGLRGNLGRLAVAVPGAVVLGLSLWVFAHEAVVTQMQFGLLELTSVQRQQATELAAQLRTLPVAWVVFCLAVTPAVCEELFFRGYLFSGLSAKMRPWATIWISALLFGLFHVVTPGGIAFVRFVPSTFLGLVLGWLAWRSASVLPGIVLHACHNGLLVLLSIYQPQLEAAGWGVAEASHLPVAWLLAAAGAVAITGGAIWAWCRPPTD
jgi:sodium transport system permease protein